MLDQHIGDPIALLNAELLRREPAIIGVRDTPTQVFIRFRAALTTPWVQLHIQGSGPGQGGSTYSAALFVSSTEVDCRTDRLQTVTINKAGPLWVFLVPKQKDAAGTVVKYDGTGTSPDNMAMVSIGVPATGPIGPPGVDGMDGPQGEEGMQGIPGARGATGFSGAPGVDGFDGMDGDMGPMGPAGIAGAAGAPGSAGAAGVMGPPGWDGPDGEPSWEPGPPGDRGATGAAGAGSGGAFPTADKITAADYTLAADKSTVVADDLEIGTGFFFEVAAGAVLDIE